MNSNKLTPADRNTLDRLLKARRKLAHTLVAERAAEMLANYERQSASIYAFDQSEVWRQAMKAVREAVDAARAKVDAECQRLGIPRTFAPEIGAPSWYGRGQTAVAERRAELRKVAQTRIEAIRKSALANIERQYLIAETEILSGTLSDAGQAFLGRLPDLEMLMPDLKVRDMEKLLAARVKADVIGGDWPE